MCAVQACLNLFFFFWFNKAHFYLVLISFLLIFLCTLLSNSLLNIISEPLVHITQIKKIIEIGLKFVYSKSCYFLFFWFRNSWNTLYMCIESINKFNAHILPKVLSETLRQKGSQLVYFRKINKFQLELMYIPIETIIYILCFFFFFYLLLLSSSN